MSKILDSVGNKFINEKCEKKKKKKNPNILPYFTWFCNENKSLIIFFNIRKMIEWQQIFLQEPIFSHLNFVLILFLCHNIILEILNLNFYFFFIFN